MSITIKTHLREGIDRSCGGGQTVTHYEWTTGPRNLLKAAGKLHKHRKDMEQSYGNIGCGRSWMEIDGTEVRNTLDLTCRDRDMGCLEPVPQLEKARRFLESVRSGEYARISARIAEAYGDAEAA